jgi:hypothetical protein
VSDRRLDPTWLEETAAAVAIAVVMVLSPLLRPWYRRWGATQAETQRPLPGDDLVPHPRIENTRAVTIQVSPADVWPWLVQMGQGRCGLYSYTTDPVYFVMERQMLLGIKRRAETARAGTCQFTREDAHG